MENYGYKYKISNLQAAMGCAQIERVEELVNRKREIFSWYRDLLIDLPVKMNPEFIGTTNSYWMPTIIVDEGINFDREELFNFMKEHKIDSRPFFYPLSSLPMFEDRPENVVSYSIHHRGINLPSHHNLSITDVRYVCSILTKYLKNKVV
jgi:perosamine synthetase